MSAVQIWAWQQLPYGGTLGFNLLLEVLGKTGDADVHGMMRAAFWEHVWRGEVVDISVGLGADDAFPNKLWRLFVSSVGRYCNVRLFSR